jgi:MoaA/NifB/PqqE/SkfB family radical SAM enzyme
MNRKNQKVMKKLLLKAIKDVSKNYRTNNRAFYALMNIVSNQNRLYKKRRLLLKENINIPPYLILSITQKCNLKCAGCYSFAHKGKNKKSMEPELFKKILNESKETGISTVFIAGGEPLKYEGLFEILIPYKEILFPVFTNGLLLNENIIQNLSDNRNIIPIISIEGSSKVTNERRGENVYETVMDKVNELKNRGILYGISITLTKNNYKEVMDDKFLYDINNKGAGVVFFVEYVPVEDNTGDLCLEENERQEALKRIEELNNGKNGAYIMFPGDENVYDGCMAAGRGFLHIDNEGNVEACPFAPYSDINLKDNTIIEALYSNLLTKIRENHNLLQETKGGCALWANKEWVKSIKQDKV